MVFERPISDLMVDKLTEGGSINNAYHLDNWRLIKSNRQIEVKIEFPEGQSVAAAGANNTRTHVEVRLFGAKTRVK